MATRQTVAERSLTTQPATTTRPPVSLLSAPTQPAGTTSHWALSPVPNSPQEITTSILTTRDSRASPTQSASASPILRGPLLLSPAYLGNQSLARRFLLVARI